MQQGQHNGPVPQRLTQRVCATLCLRRTDSALQRPQQAVLFAAIQPAGSGGNLFDAGDTEMTAIDALLDPGAREGSNFDIMDGLATMIEASRAYELNASLIKLQDQVTGQAINTVGRSR